MTALTNKAALHQTLVFYVGRTIKLRLTAYDVNSGISPPPRFNLAGRILKWAIMHTRIGTRIEQVPTVVGSPLNGVVEVIVPKSLTVSLPEGRCYRHELYLDEGDPDTDPLAGGPAEARRLTG